MTKALVTGGAGFLGSHLCDRLLADGQEVVCFDNLSTGRASNIAHLHDCEAFTYVRGDVCARLPDEEGWLGGHHLGDVDVVYNLASPASPQQYQARPLATLDAALAGSRAMLQFALEEGARIVMLSSSEVYGSPLVHPQPESYWGNVNPIGPRSMYAEGKRVAETMTMIYRTLGVDTAIARPFNVYGPRMSPHDGRVLPTFIRRALAGEPLPVYGDGRQTRSLCYVSDAVEGIALLGAALGYHEPVNIGRPDEVTMLELAQVVLQVVGSASAIEFRPLPGEDPPRRCPDVARATAVLEWAPKVELREGVALMVETMAAELELATTA